jgi:uncharacterized OsmC-like protein
MTHIKVIYNGGLRTEAEHLKSGQKIITDAPVDNNGRGEAFSPTDLVCSALTSCMMTIMGMVAERENINLDGLKADVVKIMAANPRRIQEIKVTFFSPQGLKLTEKQSEMLRRAALTCPVALSLGENVAQTVEFDF